MKITKEQALNYHQYPEPGKIEVFPSKPYATARDLSLAYSPGVAVPCSAINNNSADVWKYTGKGNLVAVISNGTAVLGLGNIGPLAAKPVMEGKAFLFKVFSGINAFDIEIDTRDVDCFVDAVRAIAPTFGGINLEDIKAPECFEIEERLKHICDIPVMHDDQHGTAIIVAAGMLNALEIQGKKPEEVRLVVNGAGAASIACSRMLVSLGVRSENIVMCDSKGVIRSDNDSLPDHKREFATHRDIRDLADAMIGADVFMGLSVADVLTPEMLKTMADKPVVFALANPDPEISYSLALATRHDLIFATGRSDLPNQINNVLGFPYIFRGALDCRASCINEEMKHAAVFAIAALAKEPVLKKVCEAYGRDDMSYGPEYILPTPFDPRLLTYVAPAVAQAAAESGVARHPITDFIAYSRQLERMMNHENEIFHCVTGSIKDCSI